MTFGSRYNQMDVCAVWRKLDINNYPEIRLSALYRGGILCPLRVEKLMSKTSGRVCTT